MNFVYPAWFSNAYPEKVMEKTDFIQKMPLTVEETSNLRTAQIACLSSALIGVLIGQKLFSISKIQSNQKLFRVGFALCGSMTFLALTCSLTHTMLMTGSGNLAEQLRQLELQILQSNNNTKLQSALFKLVE
jgi:hypothetical protein